MSTSNTIKEQQVALSTFVKLVRCTNKVTNDIHSHLPEGLTVSQFGILEALFHLGPMSQKELGAKILKSPGNLTTIINNLIRDNLVKRSVNEEDKRYYSISLSEKGRALIADIFPEHAERIRRRMFSLNEEELLYLGKLLKKLGIAENIF